MYVYDDHIICIVKKKNIEPAHQFILCQNCSVSVSSTVHDLLCNVLETLVKKKKKKNNGKVFFIHLMMMCPDKI